MQSSVLRIAERHESKLGKQRGWSTLLLIFRPKTPIWRARHEQGHCYNARSKHQAKVHVFSDEQLHIILPISPSTMLVHCLTLFKKLPMTNAFVINKKSALSLLGLVLPTLFEPSMPLEDTYQQHKPLFNICSLICAFA
jgi:hypothetical protein